MSETSLRAFTERLRDTESLPFVSELARERARALTHSSAHIAKIESLSKRLSSNDGLCLTLRLSSCGIDDGLLEVLCRGLVRNRCLQRLLLHDNRISDAGIETLCLAVESHEALRTLWLGANYVTDKGLLRILRFLHVNSTLKEVNLSNRRPPKTWTGREQARHPTITNAVAPALADYFQRATSRLVSLNLAQQRLLSDGASAIFETVNFSPLRSLSLRDNGLDDACCTALAACLRTSRHLASLDLSHNRMADDGALLIAGALPFSSSLTTLALDHNRIGERGLAALLEVVGRASRLETLTTYNNLVDDSRAETIVSMRAGARNEIVFRNSHALHYSDLPLQMTSTESEVDIVENQVFDSVRDEYASRNKLASEAVQVLPQIESHGRKPPARLLRVKQEPVGALSDIDFPCLDLRRSPMRPSSRLGYTPGIPYLGISGEVPVRSSVVENSDSDAHLFYLRVSSPLDSPLEASYPLLKVRVQEVNNFNESCSGSG